MLFISGIYRPYILRLSYRAQMFQKPSLISHPITFKTWCWIKHIHFLYLCKILNTLSLSASKRLSFHYSTVSGFFFAAADPLSTTVTFRIYSSYSLHAKNRSVLFHLSISESVFLFLFWNFSGLYNLESFTYLRLHFFNFLAFCQVLPTLYQVSLQNQMPIQFC